MKDIITPELITTVITIVVLPLLGIITKVLVALLQKKINEIEGRIKNERTVKYLDIAEDAVCTAVTAVSQSYVDTLKKEGRFDKEAMAKAFDLSKQKALSIMGTHVQEAIKEAYADLDAWVDNKIEYYVNTNKK